MPKAASRQNEEKAPWNRGLSRPPGLQAEVACATPYAAQVQGVWVELVRADIAPVVSLYVNDWNDGARRTHAKAGFRETARFTTVTFW